MLERQSSWFSLFIVLVLSTICIFLPLDTTRCSAKEVSHSGVVMVVIDAINIDDFGKAKTPFMHSLSRRASIGLMNTRTVLSVPDPDSAYVSIGAGSRSIGGPDDAPSYAYEYGEVFDNRPAQDVYSSRTGANMNPGNIAMMELEGIILGNTDEQLEKLKVTPGALGDILHAAGLKTAVIGNADVPGMVRRHVVAIAMDSKGIVDFGAVGPSTTKANPNSPAGFSTDYDQLLSEFDKVKEKADFCVIELGDSSRVEFLASHITEEMLERHRIESLETADLFLSKLSKEIDLSKTTLMIVSPTPALTVDDAGVRLTPIWVVGRGFDQGWLTSPSTRWPGLVMNSDLAPTVLAFFGLKPALGISGRPMETDPSRVSMDGMIAQLSKVNKGLTMLNDQRSAVLRTFVIIGIIIFIYIGVVLLTSWRHTPRHRHLAASLAVGVVATPLAFHLQALFPAMPMGYSIAAVTIITIVASFVARWFARGNHEKAILLLSCGTVIALVADQLLGQRLARYSLLSYNPVVGARFYGLGNEYTGVLTGAVICTALWLAKSQTRKTGLVSIGLLFSTVLVIISHPGIGADFGGALSGLVGFSATWYLISGYRIRLKTLLVVSICIVGLVAGLVALDAARGSQSSHVGQLVSAVKEGGIKEIYYVVVRKLDVNIKLVKRTIWSKLLLATLIPALPFLLTKWVPWARFTRERRLEAQLLIGALISATIAFLVNDSGVVEADTLLLYPAALLSVVLLEMAKND